MSKSLRNWIIVLAIGFVIWVCPTPQGLTPNAWHLFAVFAATIAGFILQPISMGAVAFIALTFCAITGVLKTGQALMGFGNGTNLADRLRILPFPRIYQNRFRPPYCFPYY